MQLSGDKVKKRRTWVTSVILLEYFSFYDYYQKHLLSRKKEGTKLITFGVKYCTETVSGVIISGIIFSDFLNGVYNIILKHVQNHLVTKEPNFARTKSSDFLDNVLSVLYSQDVNYLFHGRSISWSDKFRRHYVTQI